MLRPNHMGQWDKLYRQRRWTKRAKAWRQANPLCRICKEQGRITLAQVTDHVVPHRGDLNVFWYGPLQSLCRRCHDSHKQRMENKTRERPKVVDVHGKPLI